jgi:tetratricopeptide (TPR) repeat protein
MLSRGLTDTTPLQRPAKAQAGTAPAARLLAAVLVAGIAGCSMFRHEPVKVQPQAAPADGGIPARVRQRFDHAVGLMQTGNTVQAEIEFRDVVLLAPQLAAPAIDLSILYRKEGKLDEAEELLRSSASHNDSAAVWTELGVTQRLRGRFHDAADSYEKAIAADPSYAPAFRDLGVLTDLYLGDAGRALTAFERYKQLTGEDKPVSNWIAELRVRTGQPLRPASAPATPPAPPPQAASVAPPPPKADE